MKRVRGGLLVQDPDRIDETRDDDGPCRRAAKPTEEQWDDLLFAWKVCRHVRSNAIVFAKDGATVGIGAGQMSRVDSVRIAVEKAGRRVRRRRRRACSPGSVGRLGRVLPVRRRPAGGDRRRRRRRVIQPGGSKRDDEVIAACDEAGVAMVFTGRRHFRH